MDELRGYCETCGERLRPGDEIALVLLPPAAHGDYPLCRFGSVHLECSKGAEVLRAERDEARQVARRCLAWLDEALLVNNPARWYDRYPWLRGPADALPAPVPPAGEQHEHQHDPGGGEQQHTL